MESQSSLLRGSYLILKSKRAGVFLGDDDDDRFWLIEYAFAKVKEKMFELIESSPSIFFLCFFFLVEWLKIISSKIEKRLKILISTEHTQVHSVHPAPIQAFSAPTRPILPFLPVWPPFNLVLVSTHRR